MKIDKEKLDKLVAMPDGELWGEILKIASQNGFKLPDKPPSGDELNKIRNAVAGGSKINLAEAIRVVNNYRRSAKK